MKDIIYSPYSEFPDSKTRRFNTNDRKVKGGSSETLIPVHRARRQLWKHDVHCLVTNYVTSWSEE
jgi:hypothetical protein